MKLSLAAITVCPGAGRARGRDMRNANRLVGNDKGDNSAYCFAARIRSSTGRFRSEERSLPGHRHGLRGDRSERERLRV